MRNSASRFTKKLISITTCSYCEGIRFLNQPQFYEIQFCGLIAAYKKDPIAMFFAGTKMHIVTFGITAFEMVMLVIQVIYFLERPGDKRRLWYLILLVLLIFYNVCSGLFPDANIPIPLTVQTIIAYLVGFTMSMYVVYYFYRVFELRHLK